MSIKTSPKSTKSAPTRPSRAQKSAKSRPNSHPKSLNSAKKSTKKSTKKPLKRSPRKLSLKSSSKSSTTPRKSSLSLAKHSRVFTWIDYSLIGIIITSAICIAGSLYASAIYDPSRVAKNALYQLADEYYIDFLYPSTVGLDGMEDPASVLEDFKEIGYPIQRLRQLLFYDKDKTSYYIKTLANDDIFCDTNLTTARFYPVAPYGPHDYRVTFALSCTGTASKSDWFRENSISAKS